jgi:pimeloyl-ACP methyl ester carboxylesterase
MQLELVSFLSSDNLELPGLLYEPYEPPAPKPPTNKVLLWLHGNGDSGIFYNQTQMNALGQALTDVHIAFFAFNNRGAHRSKKLHILDDTLQKDQQYVQGGSNYEKIADCVYDIDGAVAYLKSRGFTEFYLAGSSTGANKICAYHVRAAVNPFSKYILAAAGDDTGIYYSELGAQRFAATLNYATQMIAAGNPLKIMPKYTGMHPYSAQACADILNPDGAYNTFPYYESAHGRIGTKPLFEEYQKVPLPMLIIYGENDEYTFTGGGAQAAVNTLRQHTAPTALLNSTFTILPGADHGFHGKEKQFAQEITNWLAK